MAEKRNILGLLVGFFVILTGCILTLFKHWELSGESWGYWFFARIFAETGRFIIFDRSPIYVLYLNLFRWLGYPMSVIVEYVVTSLVVTAMLIIFFRRYLGLSLAIFAAFLWIPFFQSAEPYGQKLALALSCAAIMVRGVNNSRFYVAFFYALLICAYVLRSTYIIFILIFIICDSIKIFRQNRFKGFLVALHPRINSWPILAVIILLVWFNTMQSYHPWNNAWFATTKWFPTKGKTMANDAFIQFSNWRYIYDKYGNFKDKDLYFTNQEVFNGADNIISAVFTNPRFVSIQFFRNTKIFFCTMASLTTLPFFFYEKSFQTGYRYYFILLLFTIPFMLAIFYGALCACKDRNIRLFLSANIFLAVATILFLPKSRYMSPLIPIFIMSAIWYGNKVSSIFKNRRIELFIGQRLSRGFSKFAMSFFIVFFSSGLTGWATIIKEVIHDFKKQEVRIIESRPKSLKTAINKIEPLVYGCKGILSLEHLFLAAFTNIAISDIYDVWEIPPFGELSSSDYRGLSPDRIDCIVVSQELSTGISLGTNHHIRYQNYIKPYVEQLKKMGAQVYNIKDFGEVIVLSQPNTDK